MSKKHQLWQYIKIYLVLLRNKLLICIMEKLIGFFEKKDMPTAEKSET